MCWGGHWYRGYVNSNESPYIQHPIMSLCKLFTGNVLCHSELDLVFGGAKDAGGLVVAHANCTLTSELNNLVTNLHVQLCMRINISSMCTFLLSMHVVPYLEYFYVAADF